MKHAYTIVGSAQLDQIATSLKQLPEIIAAVPITRDTIEVEMKMHVMESKMQDHLKKSGLVVTMIDSTQHSMSVKVEPWYILYQPLIVVVGYILGLSFLVPLSQNMLMPKEWLLMFMGFWFVIFSLFKMIDLKGFAEGYQTYDVIARKLPLWGYLYPFVELFLGVIHIWHVFSPQITGVLTLLVMGTAIIGVTVKILKKEAIQCACLGTVLKAPLSTVTFVEDALMIVFALIMITTF